MTKTLELQFATEMGGVARVLVDNPKEPIDPALVKLAMDKILATGAVYSNNGNLVSIKGARLTERNVTDYEIK